MYNDTCKKTYIKTKSAFVLSKTFSFFHLRNILQKFDCMSLWFNYLTFCFLGNILCIQSEHVLTFLKSNNYWNRTMIKMPLTIQMYIDFLLWLMPDVLLCGNAAIVVILFHSSADSDVEAISYFRDMWVIRRNGLIVTVPPLDRRSGGPTLNITLKQCPVICLIKNCDRRLCCTCEHMIDRLSCDSNNDSQLFYLLWMHMYLSIKNTCSTLTVPNSTVLIGRDSIWEFSLYTLLVTPI